MKSYHDLIREIFFVIKEIPVEKWQAKSKFEFETNICGMPVKLEVENEEYMCFINNMLLAETIQNQNKMLFTYLTNNHPQGAHHLQLNALNEIWDKLLTLKNAN